MLRALKEEHILALLQRALDDKERGLGRLNITIAEDALQQIAVFANGDARIALNVLELATQSGRETLQENVPVQITMAMIEDVMQHRALLYDKGGDQHYDTISALHKALRGSDPDAGLYWLARMLEAGEDPLYIVRRLIRFASEDVGMADPHALLVCVAAQQAVHFVGLPEANLALAQAVVHLATAPNWSVPNLTVPATPWASTVPGDPNSHWLEDGPRPGHVSWVWRAITRFAPLVDSLVDRPSPERTSRQVDPDGLQFLSATRLVPD